MSKPEEAVPQDRLLWRRIPAEHWVEDDVVPGGRRVSSAAFDDPELSVVVEGECDMDTLLSGHDGFGVVSISVKVVRDLGLDVVYAPAEGLPGHAHVMGKKTRGVCRSLAKEGTVIREPMTNPEL